MNMHIIESNVKRSFQKVKREMKILKSQLDSQNKMIQSMHDNQKYLLRRIKNLEEHANIPAPEKLVGNKKTRQLHKESCPKLNQVQETVIFTNRKDAIDLGYAACTCLLD